MHRTALLHLGMPKTGTTSIQSALFANRAGLLRAGILYPDFAENHSTPLNAILSDAPDRLPPVMLAAKRRRTRSDLRAYWSERLDRALATPSWDRLILSAEVLSAVGLRRLIALQDRLSEHCDSVTAVLCLRDPFRWRLSQIQQKLKLGSTLADETKKFSKPGLYQRVVQRAEKALGEDRVRLLIFEELASDPAGLVAGFAAATELPPQIVPRNNARNPAMSHRAVMVLDRLNRQVPLFESNRKSRRRSLWVDRALRRLPGPGFVLPVPLAERMRKAVEADRAWAQDRFGRDVWPDPMPDHLPEAPRIGGIETWTTVGRILGRVIP